MKKFAVIDIETTGLRPENGSIIEIGVVELDLETGETKIIFDSLIKEPTFGNNEKNKWIFNNSNINFEDILEAPALDDVRFEIQELFNNYWITAFNKSFDIGFLESRGFIFPNELPCIMVTATDIVQIVVEWGYKYPTCQEAWDFFFPNINYIEKHRAADDAIHEAQILYEMRSRGQFPLKMKKENVTLI